MFFIHTGKSGTDSFSQLSVMCNRNQRFSCFMKNSAENPPAYPVFFHQVLQEVHRESEPQDSTKEYMPVKPFFSPLHSDDRVVYLLVFPIQISAGSLLFFFNLRFRKPIWTGPNAISSSTLPQKSWVSAF